MKSREAFQVICRAVERGAARRIVEKFYDEQHFGSFVVSFEENGEPRSIVNDRGFVFLTHEFDGSGNSVATIPSLSEVDAQRLTDALNL
jgi:hypothetical protein